ncbi:MAG: transcriptional regulator [Gammaproteobacteria bacterium]|nr:MAG: transcriptional regulator [Gammaproteobacteria bacterium]
MRPALLRWTVLAVFVVACSGVSADEQIAGKAWLDRMSRAVQSLNYEGTFIYSHEGELETMYIVHRVDEHGERERLVSLSGSRREIVRENQKVTFFFTDDRSVVVDERLAGLFPSLGRQFEKVGNSYQFVMLGSDRVAGLDARVLDIRPRDGFRYGYRLWLEEKSGMLLRSELLDESELPIEQVMFTSITIGGHIPDNALKATTRTEGFTWFRDEPEPGTESVRRDWIVKALPDGFELTGYSREKLPGRESRVSHLVFSDGLASVSVYVEPAGEEESPEGYSRIGGLSLYSVTDGEHQVTVVGEVPQVTVESMGRSVEPIRVAGQ